MKLLLENWRGYLNENTPGTVPWTPEQIEQIGKALVKGSQTYNNHTVGHLSKAAFTQFDDSRTGSHTAGDTEGVGKGMYNLDSYFGPMFGNDKKLLTHPDHIKALGGKYMMTVSITGKFAIMHIDDLVRYFPQKVKLPDGNVKNVTQPMTQSIKDFKQWLINQGYDGVWWYQPGRKQKSGLTALTSNALSIFSAQKNAKIVAIRQLEKPYAVIKPPWKEWRKPNETPT